MCREPMRETVPGAFHNPVRLTIALGHLPPVPMAEAWMIMKTAVLATDYHEDGSFFVTN